MKCINQQWMLIFLMSFVSLANAQMADSTLVVVDGNVINASTNEPIRAKIKYESLPYGSKIGVFTGETFTFNMEDQNDYLLMVESEGFAPYRETLSIKSASNRQLEKTIALTPTGVDRVIRLEKLIFGLGKANITEESHQELDDLAVMLKSNENMSIQLEGHTDFRGNSKQNMRLSEERVEAVKDYLVSHGIDKKRIKTKAFGGTHPLSREGDTESRRKNRRVEVRILSN